MTKKTEGSQRKRGRPPKHGGEAMVVVTLRVPAALAAGIRADGEGARAALLRWAARNRRA